MGEYFKWVNVDKKQYLCPADFGQGSKLLESAYRGNPLLSALHELLSDEWKGDRIVFLGDECGPSDGLKTETLQLLGQDAARHGSGYFGDAVSEAYRNVSCLFKAAEAEVRREIGFYLDGLDPAKRGRENVGPVNEYGIDPGHPFDGLFLRDGKSFCYVINYTRKTYYSFGMTKILYLDRAEDRDIDPLPFLMGYGRSTDPGTWLGDRIGTADEIGDMYSLIEEISLER